MSDNLVELSALARGPLSRLALRLSQRLLDPLLQMEAVNDAYRRLLARKAEDPAEGFFDRALAVLNISYSVSEEDLSRIPRSGPVFLLANHPYGGVDGLVLGSLLDRVRGDGRLLVNSLLDRIDRMGGRCFYVNPFGGHEAKAENLRGMRDSLRWLRGGGALATFPAGEVSHLRWSKRQVTDPAWAENLAQLIQRTGATVVPVYFEGRNSCLFQWLGLIHPRLRTLLLPREMMAMSGRCIPLRVGNAISAKRLAHLERPRELMDFLRLRTYILQNRAVAEKVNFLGDGRHATNGQAVIAGQDPAKLAEELADLPMEACLVRSGPFAVYLARAGEVPRMMLELGRLRELTFRAVGEGTGQDRDLDRYDSTYHHLVIWNEEEREVVGAYRMGLTDEILPVSGKSGLYTTSLFRFAPGVIRSLNPAIELGRSFVVEKYQRKPQSLSLLWRGIGQFIVRNPRYKILFGPVSISKEYQSLSKNLMVTYLREHSRDPLLAGKVWGRKPPRSRFFGALDRRSFRRSVRNIEDVSALISEIEAEEKGVPVLLRQYLKLNATMLSFNVDPAFSDCIDGLVLVDLRKTSFKALSQYMGPAGAEGFLRYHQIRPVVTVGDSQ